MARIIGTHLTNHCLSLVFEAHTGTWSRAWPMLGKCGTAGLHTCLYYVTFYLRPKTVFQPTKMILTKHNHTGCTYCFLNAILTDLLCKVPLRYSKEPLMKTLKSRKQQHKNKLVICWCLTDVSHDMHVHEGCIPTHLLVGQEQLCGLQSAFPDLFLASCWLAMWPFTTRELAILCLGSLVYKPRQLQDCWGSMR